MFNIVLGFSNDPLYFGYNPTEVENPVLCIFTFQRPIRSQIELVRGLIFHEEKDMEHWYIMRRGLRPERALVVRPKVLVVHLSSLPPRASLAVQPKP
jgi:hypothetical protein